MRLTGHLVGLLKAYMGDLVEQARQEAQAHEAFGFTQAPYRPDQALSDLLAILDDRSESEGVHVGLPEEFLHQMWTVCNEAHAQIREQAWLESGIAQGAASKARTREMTYQALLAYIETQAD
nr:hypothetical protein [Nitrospirota bacterium]